MASGNIIHTLSSYNRDNVSRLIAKDLSHILACRRPNKIIGNSKSIIHFVNEQFYYQTNDEKALISTPIHNAIDNYSDIPRIRSTIPEIILQQISNNKVDFHYLSDTHLKLFLTAVLSTIDISYTISNVQETLKCICSTYHSTIRICLTILFIKHIIIHYFLNRVL